MASAFFNMSLSSRAIAKSLRSSDISLSSCFILPLPGNESKSPVYSFTQPAKVEEGTPSSALSSGYTCHWFYITSLHLT